MFVIESKSCWIYVGGLDDKGKIIEASTLKDAIIFEDEERAIKLFEYIKSIDDDYQLARVLIQEKEDDE